MSNRAKKIISLLLLVLFSASCTSKTVSKEPSDNAIQQTDGQQGARNVSLEDILLFGEAHNEGVADETIDNIVLKRTRYTLTVEGKEEGTNAIKLDFQYPQLSGLEDKTAERTVNLMLFDVAFKVFGDEMTLCNVKEALEKAVEYAEFSPSSTDLVAQVDYEIISYTPPYLSLRYFGDNVAGGARVNVFEQLLTIDIDTATYLPLVSTVDVDALERKILQGDFEVLSGRYLPGGWDETKVPALFWDAIIRGLDEETLKEWHSLFSSRWDSGESIQTIYVQGQACCYHEYDSFTSNNHAFDDNSIYVRFVYADSLNGYVILKIPRE